MQCVNPRSSLELRRQLAAVTTEGKTATPAPDATAAVREIFSNFPGVTVLRRRTRVTADGGEKRLARHQGYSKAEPHVNFTLIVIRK